VWDTLEDLVLKPQPASDVSKIQAETLKRLGPKNQTLEVFLTVLHVCFRPCACHTSPSEDTNLPKSGGKHVVSDIYISLKPSEPSQTVFPHRSKMPASVVRTYDAVNFVREQVKPLT
jgi:hypothetical protein